MSILIIMKRKKSNCLLLFFSYIKYIIVNIINTKQCFQMFTIVRFLEEDLVELVPQKWLKKQKCWYPNIGAAEKAKKLVDPSEESGSWYSVKILGTYGKIISEELM